MEEIPILSEITDLPPSDIPGDVPPIMDLPPAVDDTPVSKKKKKKTDHEPLMSDFPVDNTDMPTDLPLDLPTDIPEDLPPDLPMEAPLPPLDALPDE